MSNRASRMSGCNLVPGMGNRKEPRWHQKCRQEQAIIHRPSMATTAIKETILAVERVCGGEG